MADSSPNVPGGDERPPPNSDLPSTPVLPIGAASQSDNAATVISKHMPRLLSNEEALKGIRGRKLAHFELIDRIGVGGMAAVLRARDTQLDRFVALKILPPDMALDEENVRRFHQEARSAAKLDHENVARVFFCGEDQRLHFIAFEFVEGQNLRTILESRGRLPVGEALHYMLQVAAGLAHAWQRGVVHRDIKPSNIIITPTGRAKLVDMGLARTLEPQHDVALTQSGVTLGTFDYISPEQALEPREADVRSDIYSLGCTFYHMLTGRPPTPEGTAARKLHHHQHVKPQDPRELVPGLPDDVALILARMLAKQPSDRYQTPQQLVHHLLAAARNGGGAGEVPEGVLSMEAVVPNPPRYRPVLLAALATVAVVVLILIIGQGVSTPPHAVIGNLTPSPKPARDKEAPAPVDKDHSKDQFPQPQVNPPNPPTAVVYDADDVTPADLAKWLRENNKAEALDIRLARDLDLLPSSRDEPGDPRLVFKAPKVRISPKAPLKSVTVRLNYSPGIGSTSRTGFTVDSKDATIDGVHFVIDARGVDEDLIGLLCASGGNYTVRRCQFVQANEPKNPDMRSVGVSSVVVDGAATRTGKTRLILTECCFLGFKELTKVQGEPNQADVLQLKDAAHGGFHAVVRRGAAQIEAINCAFGPHDAVFRLEGGEGGPSDLLVQHCSVLAGRRCVVFALGDGAAAALTVNYSLFSHSTEGEGDAAVLFRQTSNPGTLTFKEHDNRYHRLELGAAAAQLKIPQEGSRELVANPWKEENPVSHLDMLRFSDPATKVGDASVAGQRQDQIGAAFLVNFQDHLADVQPVDQKMGLIGVERLGDVSYLRMREKETPVVRKGPIVDPTVAAAGDGVYPSLSLAIEAAKHGDEILIKHNGDLAVKPARLEDIGMDLTIRPYPDCHPVLTLGTATDVDAALFRIFDGKLQFEGLEFRLEPKDRNFKSQTVAAVIGNGQCGFKNCVVTLDPGGFSAALAAVSLPDFGGMMKSDAPLPRTQPRVVFENCVVRGQGDLVCDRTGRAFDLEAKNTLTVLAGNFLNVEVTAEPTAAQLNTILTNVTAYQTGHFIRMHSSKDVKTLPSLACKTTSCLFVAADSHSLIHLEGPEMTGDQLKDKLGWTVGEGGNVYARYGDMLDQRPHGEEMPMPAIMADKWKAFTGEMTIKVPRDVKFAAEPPRLGPFNRIAPAHFKAPDLPGFGADVGTLPKPAVSSPDSE
jgi:serine/threonine protein kinase